MFIKIKKWAKVDPDFAVWNKEGQHTPMKEGDVVEVKDNEAKGLLITYGNVLEEASKPVEEPKKEAPKKKEEPKKKEKSTSSKK